MSQITNQTKYGQIQYTSISKNVNQYKSNDIVQKYNNKYHNTIKMKPVDIIYIYIYIYTRNCQNFYDKELRKANKKSLEQINFMSNGKAT